jgi:hypothetical protein
VKETTMKILTLSAAALLATAPLAAQGADPDRAAQGGGQLPAGWSLRLDTRSASAADVKVVTMGTGVHVTTGPSGILWRAADATEGRFHTEATITRTKAPTHPEAYGLFVAGRDLQADTQTYIYFLTRGDGKFLISRANGIVAASGRPAVTPVTQGWTDHAAVAKANAAGQSTDKLEIATADVKLRFSVNGQLVLEMAAAGLDLRGIVGLRVNHNLDVHVEGFVVHKL